MPLIRRPYQDEQSNLKSSSLPEQGYGSGSSVGNVQARPFSFESGGSPRQLPTGFVNTDRLVDENRELIDNAKQRIAGAYSGVDDVKNKYEARKSAQGAVDSSPEVLSVDDILDLAGKNPDQLRERFGWQARDPEDIGLDKEAFDPIFKNMAEITTMSGADQYNPNPFQYGLLKSGGALNDNTFSDYLTKIQNTRTNINSDAAKYNSDRDALAKSNTMAYNDSFRKRMQGILDESLPQLREIRPVGAINIGGKERTSRSFGGTSDERSYLTGALKNIASILGQDPNTINAGVVDKEWTDAVTKQYDKTKKGEEIRKEREKAEKEREEQRKSGNLDVDEELETREDIPNQAKIHVNRAKNSKIDAETGRGRYSNKLDTINY